MASSALATREPAAPPVKIDADGAAATIDGVGARRRNESRWAVGGSDATLAFFFYLAVLGAVAGIVYGIVKASADHGRVCDPSPLHSPGQRSDFERTSPPHSR